MENADLVNAVTVDAINDTIRHYYVLKRVSGKSV